MSKEELGTRDLLGGTRDQGRGTRWEKGRTSRAFLVLAAVLCAGCAKDNAQPAARDSGATGSIQAVRPSSPPEPRPSSPVPQGTVLFIGTSLTAGLGLDPDSAYPALIQRRIDSAGLAFRAVNAGVSGETSAALLRRLDWLLRQPAAVIVLEAGANDGLRGIPVETARRNIGEVLRRVKAAQPGARVVLVQMEAPPNLGGRYAGAFRAMYGELAREYGAVLMPFLLDGVAGRAGLNQADGIHPNEEGERIVAENVWRALEPELRRVAQSGP